MKDRTHPGCVLLVFSDGMAVWMATVKNASVVKSNDVFLFMKGTPVFPMCGFSAASVQILSHLGVRFKGINVLEDPAVREGIKAYSDWPTIPQLYVKGEFVGGCDILKEMFTTG